MPLIRIIIRVAYAPVFFVGFLWSAVTLAEKGAPLWGLPILLVMALAISFVAERVAPYERAWNRSDGDNGRDLIHAVVNETSIFLSVLAVPLVAGLIPNFGVWPGGSGYHPCPLRQPPHRGLVAAARRAPRR